METLIDLAISLGIGSLIGLERGWHERAAAEGTRIAGLRTFALVGLLGGLWGLLGRELGDVLLGFAFLALVALMLVARFQSHKADGDAGITTAVALLVTFSLGALVLRGYRLEAASVAVVVTVLLSLKPVLHHSLQRIEPVELKAFLQLLLISVVLLPVLPDEGLGPWGLLNPYEIWWLVVLIAGISFIGYVAMKIAGVERGVLFTALFGGLVSSTAVTINLSRMATQPAVRNVIVTGILLASATMFPRTLAIVSVVNTDLVAGLTVPLMTMFAVMFAGVVYYWRKQRGTEALTELPITRPIDLGMAIKFGLFLVAITLLARVLQSWLGDTGVYLLGVFSGAMDVDAVSLSLAQLARTSLEGTVAVHAIVLATITNTLVKTLLVFLIADHKLGWQVARITLPALLAGILAVSLI